MTTWENRSHLVQAFLCVGFGINIDVQNHRIGQFDEAVHGFCYSYHRLRYLISRLLSFHTRAASNTTLKWCFIILCSSKSEWQHKTAGAAAFLCWRHTSLTSLSANQHPAMKRQPIEEQYNGRWAGLLKINGQRPRGFVYKYHVSVTERKMNVSNIDIYFLSYVTRGEISQRTVQGTSSQHPGLHQPYTVRMNFRYTYTNVHTRL